MDNNSGKPLANIVLRGLRFLLLTGLFIASRVIALNPPCPQQKEQYLIAGYLLMAVALTLAVIFNTMDEERKSE